MKFLHLISAFLILGNAALFADAGATATGTPGTVSPATDSPTSDSAAMAPNADYQIAIRDTIQFQVYNQPDMTTIQRISANGEIRLPLIGTVKMAQLTLRDAEHLLEKCYRDEGFFINPQVILSVQQYGDRFVAVLGQVKEPARVPLASETNTIGILQAITQVGGFTRVARTDAVQVLRTGADGQDHRLIINTDTLLHPTEASRMPEFQLQPGDIVFVPERTF
jgi:polysaccharide export outer membrane protein